MIAPGPEPTGSTIGPDSVVTLAIVILPLWAGSTAVRAGVAQLVEHLICNQTVGGSSPFASSRVFGPELSRRNHSTLTFWFPFELVGAGKRLRNGVVWTEFTCAQVAEWLMAADCKSAAPWSYGGSNPPLCTRDWKMDLAPRSPGRMWMALALLAVLGALTVRTIDPGKVRAVVLLLLGFFALRIVLTGFASR
jgi:hypothetical protein